jgi:pimeloyl-ACP methyl ester carboxylesterase
MDGIRTYFETDRGYGTPAALYTGLNQPLDASRASGIAAALADRFRLVFADHRGHGRSDKPHEVEDYHLRTRVADATALLDGLGIERAHFIGFSWGARLGFAIGEHLMDDEFGEMMQCYRDDLVVLCNGASRRGCIDSTRGEVP